MGLETSAPPNGRPATDGGEAAPAGGRAASPQPGGQPAAAAPAPGLPPIAEKADDLEAIGASGRRREKRSARRSIATADLRTLDCFVAGS
jgi:hypothetical protein